VFLEHYAWVPGLRKIRESNVKDLGHSMARPGDTYVLWANR
jgi:hypothetical protein